MTKGIPNIELRHLYRLEASLEARMDMGTGPYGYRRCIMIKDGTFEGERMRGTVLPGGADHMIVGEDQTAYVDTRYNLRTHDGALIYIQTKGVRSGPPEIMNALLEGKEVDSSKYDFHLHAFLETGDERYWWLNKAIIVGRAVRWSNGIAYDAYEVVTTPSE